MSEQPLENLADATARGLPITLTWSESGLRKSYRSRFLVPGEGGIWVEQPASSEELVAAMIREGLAVTVGVTVGSQELRFSAPILRCEAAFGLGDGVSVAAFLVASPIEVQSKQRRGSYRVHVNLDDEVSCRIWRIADKAELKKEPARTAEIGITLANLSNGGAGIVIKPMAPGAVRPITGQRLRVVITHPAGSILLEGRLTWPNNSGEEKGASVGIPAGIRFEKLDDDIAGRQAASALTRVVGSLQRNELRRMRTGT